MTEAAYLQETAEERVQSAQPGFYEQVARAASPNAGDDELAALATFLRYGATPGAVEAVSRMNMSIDVRQVLPTVSVPTLVLHCAGDPWCPVGDCLIGARGFEPPTARPPAPMKAAGTPRKVAQASNHCTLEMPAVCGADRAANPGTK